VGREAEETSVKPDWESPCGRVKLFNADCRDVLPFVKADVVITDPPFSANTHEMTRSNSDRAKAHGNRVLSGSFGFNSITEEELRAIMSQLCQVTQGWVVASLDYKHAFAFDREPPRGLRMLRIGIWLKKNPNPQISGDRPALGWESIAYMHRSDRRPSWNGGGKAANFFLASAQNANHPTAKPILMVEELVRLFSDPSESIFDPFAGSGTTGVACVRLGRSFVGVEIDPYYFAIAVRRIQAELESTPLLDLIEDPIHQPELFTEGAA
jgi:site-specific DNA-methyltransferase (adenine-specific)